MAGADGEKARVENGHRISTAWGQFARYAGFSISRKAQGNIRARLLLASAFRLHPSSGPQAQSGVLGAEVGKEQGTRQEEQERIDAK